MLHLQVIGFVYGLIIEQFGWTVYIVLAGFAVSCVVSCIYSVPQMRDKLVECLSVGVYNMHNLVVEGSEYTEFYLFPPLLADPASMANVQKESFVLAATHSRDQWGDQPETSRKYQEEEAQVIQKSSH